MGLLDSIKKTASNAVNSVTGNRTSSKPQSTQPIQTSVQTKNVSSNSIQSQTQENGSEQLIQTSVQTENVNSNSIQSQTQESGSEQPIQTSLQTENVNSNSIQSQAQENGSEQPIQNSQPSNSISSENSFLGIPFYASGITTVITTRFYTDHLRYGDEKIPYNELSEITVINMPSGMTNGSAQVWHYPTKRRLTLSFKDFRGFLAASDYANDKIAEANGISVSRKCSIYNVNSGEKLVLFDDYISVKRLGKGLSGVMGQGNNSVIIMISKISGIKVVNDSQLVINYSNDNGSTSQYIYACSQSNAPTLNKIVSYVQNFTPDTIEEKVEEDVEDTWTIVTGYSRDFSLLGKSLNISEEMDAFNTYRNMYMDCALKYSKLLKNNYLKKVHDFDSFMKFYIPMYKEYLEKMIMKTTDILVSAGVFTETNESIMAKHIEKYHLALDDYNAMYESLQLTIQKNKQSVSSLTSLVPNLVGGGFGISGAVKGIAQATAFNLVRDSAESALVNGMNINQTQKAELYSRINLITLFDRVFLDYWRVCGTLVSILKENGKEIWESSDDDSAKADNIMKNVSNPNFPQEQFADVMISVIQLNPYKRSIYELLKDKGADENEISTICEYFGYTENTPDIVK